MVNTTNNAGRRVVKKQCSVETNRISFGSNKPHVLTFFCLLVLDRSWQFLWRSWGYDWLQTKPMDEMELDHNHSCPLHGESKCFFIGMAVGGRGCCHWRHVINGNSWIFQVTGSVAELGLNVVCVLLFSGLLHLLSGEVQALDLQQGLWVSWMGNWSGLVFGFGLHDLHPHGDGHQDPAVWGTSDWSELTHKVWATWNQQGLHKYTL